MSRLRVSEGEIANFFKDILQIFEEPTKLTKQVNDKDSQRTNVIYITTSCNLRCEYCYESASRSNLPDQANCTPKQIDEFIEEIAERENDKVSTVVLMGGEPLMRMDLVEYIIDKALRTKKNKGWGFSLITNGTFLFETKIFLRLISLVNKIKQSHISLSLEISYDGSGHIRRPYKAGASSTSVVEEVMKRLEAQKIEYKISYTVHKANYANFERDMMDIIVNFNPTRICVGFAYEDLEIDTLKNLKKEYIKLAEELFDTYGIPICNLTCNKCRICKKKDFVGNAYLSPTTGISYEHKQTTHEFQQF